jgi:LysM repeat protein
MSDKLTNNPNPDEEDIARKLSEVAGQTHPSGQFAAALEEKLRRAHQPTTGWFSRLSPVLPWVAVIIVLGLILSWSIKSLVPVPQPVGNGTPAAGLATPTPITTPNIVTSGTATPVVLQGGIDWRQTKLYLNVPLPQSPAQAHVYSLKEEQPVTVEMAQAIANQFGVQGPVFQVPGRTADQNGYMVTNGRQRMYVQSPLDYTYYSDYSLYSFLGGNQDVTDDRAAAVIEGFLKSHGLDFPYKFVNPQINPGMYYVLPLSPDGLPVYHDYNVPARLELTLDRDGQVILMASHQIGYETAGTYSIRTAEEAFQQILDQSGALQNGVLETMHSAGLSDARFWSRTYPDNEIITIFGQPAYYPAAQGGQPPYLGIGKFTVSGNTSGLESVDPATYIEATGRFIPENGIRTFHIDSWMVTDAAETFLAGNLHQEGASIVLNTDEGQKYVIEDAPSDLPLDTPADSPIGIQGFLKDGQFHWEEIQYYPPGSGGGGGGGSGTGFYKLNLSGTPVPFPSPTAQASTATQPGTYSVREGDTCAAIANSLGVSIRSIISENNLASDCLITIGQVLKIPGSTSTPSIVGQKIEGVRGLFMVIIHKLADGSQRVEYGLYPVPNEGPFFYATLQGDGLQELEAYHNHPVDIWGTVTGVDQNGMPQVQVERYEIPYPDLQFQILKGTQKVAELEGERVALFTTDDGTTYVQLTSVGNPDITILGTEGSPVIMQTLAIPGESFGGYPALRMFDAAMAVNPKDGQPMQFTGSADKPNIIDESVQPGIENYIPPELTIESVELVYYVPGPNMNRQGSGPDAHYLQPAWRFYGHYSDGSEVEFLVQALKQEFLLPELEPYTGPG